MCTNSSMIHSTSEQSVTDCNGDIKCSQPQISHPTNKIGTSFHELCVQEKDHPCKFNIKMFAFKLWERKYLIIFLILATVAKQSIDDTKVATGLQLSSKISAVPAAIVSDVTCRDISLCKFGTGSLAWKLM